MVLEIVYRDAHFVAIDKPSGLFVHPTDLDRRAMSCMPLLRDQIGQWVYPVHRLDRATSGVLLFALSAEMAHNVSNLFQTRQVKKEYLTVVRGYLPESGQIDYAYVPPDGAESVSAVRDFRCLATVELPYAVGRYATARYSLMQALPLTGRMHQIRRHCAHVRHPIVGDRTYGDRKHNRFFDTQFGIHRLMLMATHLQFAHPETGDELTLDAPVPSRIRQLFEQFGWDDFAVQYGRS